MASSVEHRGTKYEQIGESSEVTSPSPIAERSVESRAVCSALCSAKGSEECRGFNFRSVADSDGEHRCQIFEFVQKEIMT